MSTQSPNEDGPTPSAVKSRPIGEMSPLPVFSFRSQILTSPGNGFLAARPVARIDGNTGCQSTAYTACATPSPQLELPEAGERKQPASIGGAASLSAFGRSDTARENDAPSLL
eukprot:2035144-Rhodomonas_salina.4